MKIPDHCLTCKKPLGSKTYAVFYMRNGNPVIYCGSKCDPRATKAEVDNERRMWEQHRMKLVRTK